MRLITLALVSLAGLSFVLPACGKPQPSAPAASAKPAPVEPAMDPAANPTPDPKPATPTPEPKPVNPTPDPKPATPNPTPTPAPTPGDALMDPNKLKDTAPETYKVNLKTTKGDVVILVNREWAPNGADRFYNLVKNGYYNDIAIFRVVSGFMAQFGIHGDPKLNTVWRDASIPDDAGKQPNTRGRITFATRGPNTRTAQLFINYVDNSRLDSMGFSPFGEVVTGMDIVDALYSGYGEGAPRGRGPDQGRMQSEGNVYLKKDFPQLDYIISAEVLP